MRNILVFPTGEELDFMYPTNKVLEVGSQFNIDMSDNIKELVEITEIKTIDNKIYYLLKTIE